MKVNSYRVEFNRIDGTLARIQHYTSVFDAEARLKSHSVYLEDKSNIMPSNIRYGTIWASHIITNH